jgi:CheY-like chemotaxis protein
MKSKLNCILLVDDDEPTNFLNQMVLEELNITKHIQIAQNGQEALSYLAKTGSGDKGFPLPELILLDINMPAMNGWEFLQHYAQLPETQKANVVIVMLTTSLNPDDRSKAEEISEVTGFETKPMTADKIRHLLKSYFPEMTPESVS